MDLGSVVSHPTLQRSLFDPAARHPSCVVGLVLLAANARSGVAAIARRPAHSDEIVIPACGAAHRSLGGAGHLLPMHDPQWVRA